MSKSKNTVKKAAEAKPEKKRVAKVDRTDLRTLALRVTNAEFELVHRAAGPRGLSTFMKTAILSQATKSLSK